jgi:hypothetical protein
MISAVCAQTKKQGHEALLLEMAVFRPWFTRRIACVVAGFSSRDSDPAPALSGVANIAARL